MAKYYFTHDNGGYVLENEETAFRHVGACSNLSVRMRDASESVEITDISWRKWAPILYETSADDIYITDTEEGYDEDVLTYSALCTYLHSIIVSGGGSGDSVEWSDITGDIDDNVALAGALEGKQDVLTAGTGISINDNVISATGGGGSQVQSDWSQSDSSAVDYIKNKPTLRQPATDGTAGQYLKSAGSGNAPTWETMDTTPTASSAKAITSGAVYTALGGKQPTLTFDSAPTANSTNPVTSGGVYTAIDGKQNTLTFDSAPTANSTNPVTSGGVKTALDGKADASTVRFVIHTEYNVNTGVVTLASTTTQAELMSALTDKKAMDIDFTIAGTYYRNPMLSFYGDGTGAYEVRFRNDAMGFDVVLTANTTSNTYAFDVRQFVMTESAYSNLQSVDPILIYYLTADPQS